MKLFNIIGSVCLMASLACTIEVPVDEIEIPPIENQTTIILNWPDGLVMTQEAADVQESDAALCEYQPMPDYPLEKGYIIYCTGAAHENRVQPDKTCCTWAFPEREQVCEEKWCEEENDPCGWQLISWECHSY
jgi:hypothetical protein